MMPAGTAQGRELAPELPRDTSHQPQNRFVRSVSTVLSYVFHPLFVPVWMVWFLIRYQPTLFASFGAPEKMMVLIQTVVIYTFFPMVTVGLLKALGFIGSIQLKTQRERIIPYITINIYYFWRAYVLHNQPEFPHEMVQFAIAIFLASSVGLMMNTYLKISMHALSMGIILVMMALLSMHASGFTIYLSVAVLIAGLVCTSRMIVSDHTPREIYLGLLAGGLSMLAAVWVDGILP